MNPSFAPAITQLQEQIKPLIEKIRPVQEQIDDKKKLVNQLCEAGGDAPLYPEVLGDQKATAGLGPMLSDQYFGKPLATVVRDILERRKKVGLSAINLDDLYDAMKSGGYAFDNRDVAIAKRNVAITLGKNPAFMKVPSTGDWGLAEWYPGVKAKKEKANEAKLPEEPEAPAESGKPKEEIKAQTTEHLT